MKKTILFMLMIFIFFYESHSMKLQNTYSNSPRALYTVHTEKPFCVVQGSRMLTLPEIFEKHVHIDSESYSIARLYKPLDINGTDSIEAILVNLITSFKTKIDVEFQQNQSYSLESILNALMTSFKTETDIKFQQHSSYSLIYLTPKAEPSILCT